MTEPPNVDALAEALREPTATDADLARIERNLARELRARRAAPSTAPRFVIGTVGLAMAAAAVLWIARGAGTPAPVAESAPPSTPTPSIPALAAGAELASGAGQLGNARLEVAAGSLARVDDDAIAHAAVTLARGEVRVAFHPEHRGAEHLAIVTDVARVEVVGTEFVVARGESGTHVAVTEGVVRVTTLATGGVHEVRAGEALDVSLPVPSPVVEASAEASGIEVPSRRAAPSDPLPTLEAARTAAAAGDRSGLERLATEGSRADRLAALHDLDDDYARVHDREGELRTLERIMALDPSGDEGALALYQHATLASDAAELARYLAQHPDGAFAAQARQRLCALDPARCEGP